MILQKPQQSNAPMKILLSGPSGSGKTFSALHLAKGLTGNWKDICLIDTEFGSGSFYSKLGEFNVIKLDPPYHPNRFVEALNLAVESGMKTIIIDSISHEWSGKGGCLELHEKTTSNMKVPNSFTAWSVVTPLHQSFLDAIIQCSVHVIATARSRTEYILVERNGKHIPQKVGMAPLLRDGTEYEFSVHLELDQLHRAHCTKDRTQLFQDAEPFQITTDTGKKILKWLSGDEAEDMQQKIKQCKTMQELRTLFQITPVGIQEKCKHLFRARKAELMTHKQIAAELKEMPIFQNGNH